MYGLLGTGMNRNDVIKKGSRSAGTTRTQSTDYGTTTGSLTRQVHSTTTNSVEFTIWSMYIRYDSLFWGGGLVKFTIPWENFNRLTSVKTSSKLKQVNSIFRNAKFNGHFWLLGRVLTYMHTQYKIYDQDTELKVSKFKYCVLKAVTSITVNFYSIFSLKVDLKPSFGTFIKTNIIFRSRIRGLDSHLPYKAGTCMH